MNLRKRIESLRKIKSGKDKEICNVVNCTAEVKRSISMKKVQNALPNMKFKKDTKKVHLCREHYKEFKKATKADRKIETLTWK